MLNPYQVIWLFVIFDIPTKKKKDAKEAYKFRKNLLKDGFTMMQYSVYIRHCSNRPNADTHIRRVRNFLPSSGKVSILTVTDKQYSQIVNFSGRKENEHKYFPKQLEIF